MSEEQSRHGTGNEIIIVKRRVESDGDGHHGGVWKIAYADFMTAMMAFFLVMWLVNAANEETKASVASYFNPIKLLDERPRDRGIKDAGNADTGEVTQPKSKIEGSESTSGVGAESGSEQNATAGEESRYSEADYFENPFSVLAEIARETGQQANISAAGEGGAQDSGPSTGAEGGEAYRDPFDPDFWTQQVEMIDGPPRDPNDVAEPVDGMTVPAGPSDTRTDAADPADDSIAETAAGARPVLPDTDLPQVLEASPADDAAPAPGEDTPAEAAEPEAGAQAEALQRDLAASLGGEIGRLAEGLTVRPAEGGLLVTLSDPVADGMFNIGSAVPRREMVLAMERIGRVLAEREGRVVLRGHTDARPFAGDGNDNWQLSSARAQSAYYMLVRGGLDESRVVQISGFADRRPLVSEDPFADANRRIEILLEAGGR